MSLRRAALGRSLGGFTTKTHLRCNVQGPLIGLVLSDGRAHDVNAYDALAGVFENVYLDEIVRGRLADYVSKRVKSRTKGATVRRDLAILWCLCSCIVAGDFIETNPVRQYSKRYIRESPPRTAYPLPSWLADMARTAVTAGEEAVDRGPGAAMSA